MAVSLGDGSIGAKYTPVSNIAKLVVILLIIEGVSDLASKFYSLDIISIIAAFLGFIVFLIWFYRVDRNLPALGASELQFTPRWAVIWWFIPILNLWKPYQVAVEIMKSSDPSVGKTDAQTRRQMKRPNLILVWWVYLFVSVAISLAVYSLQNLHSSPTVETILVFGEIVLTILVVNEITKRQKREWELITSGGF